ncbi:MAG: GNAT family N-acetyltransferase [Actinomycetota bacterium]|nr:GNAT family N-acetyltransferase [Actinomycetota bacterium]
MPDAVLLQNFLRATAARGRAVVRVAPFTAYIDPVDALRFFNYAIPDDDAAPDPSAVERLRAEFARRHRLPRLEWIEESAPRVAAILDLAGMTEELRAPLMACAQGDVVDAATAVAHVTVKAAGPQDARELVHVQRAAFGQDPLPDDHEVTDPAARGGGAVVARIGREVVATAAWTKVLDGVTEIVGVATAEAWRRRGLAGAVTAAATRAAFAAGATTCILSPGSKQAQRVYARAGFSRVATMLHWKDPA